MDDTSPMDGERVQEPTSATTLPRTVTIDPTTGEILDESSPPLDSNVVALSPDGLFPTQCQAHYRRGTQCGRAPVPGATVCHYHGGAAPQVREKAAERIAHARDLSLERYIEFVADDGDIADPTILLNAIIKLTSQVELLQGRATSRTEVDERVHYEQVRVDLIARLDDLADRHRLGIQRPPDDDPGPAAIEASSTENVAEASTDTPIDTAI